MIKEEALKMFDNDYDILYHMIKDTPLLDRKTVRELLLSHYENPERLSEIETMIPTLTIFVPELPEDSFSAKSWDTDSEVPQVAIRMYTTNDVPIFDAEGNETVLASHFIPGYPVVVVKENERVIASKEKAKSLLAKGSKFTTTKKDLEFIFLSNAFDRSKYKPEQQESIEQAKITFFEPDQKLIDAYNIYKNADGWQRDFIYYNITPSNTRDQFYYDFKENITKFSLRGDPMGTYSRISDQTGDPVIRNFTSMTNSGWTGGSFEFMVKILHNSKTLDKQDIHYFTKAPERLFDLDYERCHIHLYCLSEIEFDRTSVDIPLINWNLNDYASSMKIEIEEIDQTVSTTITDKRTVEFATNFGINAGPGGEGILEKVGLKFGASLKVTKEESISKFFTEGNDPLGSVTINFADNVLIDIGYAGSFPAMYKYYKFREYSASLFSIEVQPKRVQ